MRMVDSAGIHACEPMLGTASSLRLKQHKSDVTLDPLEKIDFSFLRIDLCFCFYYNFVATWTS
jgi:hypothetical protein